MEWKECEIPLMDNWFIKSDQYQWICIQRKKSTKGKNKGKWYWDSDSATYYRTIPHLVEEWGTRMSRMGGYKTLRELVEYTRRVESVLNEIASQTVLRLPSDLIKGVHK